MNQRGNELDVRVFDQYKSQGERTYLPVPFFLSSQGYGLYIATNRHVAYDLAASHPDRWSLKAELGPTGVLEYYIAVADDPKRIIAAFTALTGRPALPPAWVFGPWMSGNEWNSQASVVEQVHKTIQHGIPVTVLVIEAWSDEATFYIWNDARYTPKSGEEPFTYNEFTFPPDGRWPDPKNMIEELHRLGIRVLLWQIPVISHDLSLILRTSAPSTVAVDGVQLPRNTDFATWCKTPASGWCYDEAKGLVFVKLAAAGSPRTVELSAWRSF